MAINSPASLTVVPLSHPQPLVCIGIDIGKKTHNAGFVSSSLLARHKRFERCPTLPFENSRVGYLKLLERIRSYAPLANCAILIEHTGHYHRALEAYLQECGVSVYVIAIHQKRTNGLNKTDKIDALRLANELYSQVVLGHQVADKSQVARRRLPPTPLAAELAGLVQRHQELAQTRTKLKNRLIAICDEVFPEFTNVIKDPNGKRALTIRTRFPTPADLARADFATAVYPLSHKGIPGRAKLLRLQEQARSSIGIRAGARQKTLLLEQRQLIESLTAILEHEEEIDQLIESLVLSSREGQILLSIPPIGTFEAAAIIAHISNIHNFRTAALLRKYFGWSPQETQTGTSLDSTNLTKTGVRLMRRTLCLIAMRAVDMNTEWKELYLRLLPRKCTLDLRTGEYKGKLRVLGRIAGQLVNMLYCLLRQDADLVASLPPDQLPPPVLYDPKLHHAHRHGQYQSYQDQQQIIQSRA